MRFGMKFDKKGIPAFVLILIMMFQGNPTAGEETAVSPTTPSPMTLTLVDETFAELLTDLPHTQEALILDASTLPETFNLLVTAENADIDAIQFLLNDENLRLDEDPPFTIADEEAGWRLPEAGEHTLTAIPFTTIQNEVLEAGEPLTITFSVAENKPSENEETP